MNKRFFLRASKKIDENKKTYKEKAAETKAFSARYIEMQQYVDSSPEKMNLLLNILQSNCPDDPKETILQRGAVVFCTFLDVIDKLRNFLQDNEVPCEIITGKTKTMERGRIARDLKENPEGKVVIVSKCASESLNLNFTNILIVYSVCGVTAPGPFSQLVGRVARGFSKRFNLDPEMGPVSNVYIIHCVIEETCDEYAGVLLSARKELEEEILHKDEIPLKDVGSYDAQILKEIRQKMLWKTKKRK